MYKKMWKMGFVFMAVMIILIGCTSAPNLKGEEPSASTVTIKLHTWYNKQTDNWDPVLEAFHKKYPNINIEFVSDGSNNTAEFLKKLDLSVASGEDLDIVMTGSQKTYVTRAVKGMFEPLNGYMEKDGLNYDSEYTVDSKFNDKYYGIPGKNFMSIVLLNSEHLKEAGLPVPKDWTWDEYLDYAKKLTKVTGTQKRYGTFFLPSPPFTDYLKLALYNQPKDSNFIKDDGKTLNTDNPLLRKSLEIRSQAEKDKSVTPYAEVLSQKLNYRQQYFNQNISMLTNYTYMITEAGGTDKIPANFKTVFAPFPKANKNDQIMSPVTSDFLSIYARSKHKEEAYKFIRWYTTEGILLQGRFLPAWKKADISKSLDSLISISKNPEMVDKESALYVLKNTIVTNPVMPVVYQDEVDKAFAEEVDNMMLDNQSIDKTLKNAGEKIQKLIDVNK